MTSELNEIRNMINSSDIETVKLGLGLLQEYSTDNKNLLIAKRLSKYIFYTIDFSKIETIAVIHHILWLIDNPNIELNIHVAPPGY